MNMKEQYALAGVLGSLLLGGVALGESALTGRTTAEKGTVSCKPEANAKNIPDRYRLDAAEFSYEMALTRQFAVSGLDVFSVRFPSPVNSPCAENNTVYAEYYRPRGEGPFPG